MKKLLLSIALLFTVFTAAFAQDRDDKIKALYVAYITQELSITPDEAKTFWPLHNQYDTEIRAAVSNNNNNELDRQQAVLDIKKKYQDKFQKLIGTDRTNEFFVKDSEFRKRMIERLKQKRQQGAKP